MAGGGASETGLDADRRARVRGSVSRGWARFDCEPFAGFQGRGAEHGASRVEPQPGRTRTSRAERRPGLVPGSASRARRTTGESPRHRGARWARWGDAGGRLAQSTGRGWVAHETASSPTRIGGTRPPRARGAGGTHSGGIAPWRPGKGFGSLRLVAESGRSGGSGALLEGEAATASTSQRRPRQR